MLPLPWVFKDYTNFVFVAYQGVHIDCCDLFVYCNSDHVIPDHLADPLAAKHVRQHLQETFLDVGFVN